MLKQIGITKTPQEMILKYLPKEIIKHKKNGCKILICIDANEQLTDTKSRIRSFASKLGLVDVATEKYDNIYNPHTYKSSSTQRRIDFILCSR